MVLVALSNQYAEDCPDVVGVVVQTSERRPVPTQLYPFGDRLACYGDPEGVFQRRECENSQLLVALRHHAVSSVVNADSSGMSASIRGRRGRKCCLRSAVIDE